MRYEAAAAGVKPSSLGMKEGGRASRGEEEEEVCLFEDHTRPKCENNSYSNRVSTPSCISVRNKIIKSYSHHTDGSQTPALLFLNSCL